MISSSILYKLGTFFLFWNNLIVQWSINFMIFLSWNHFLQSNALSSRQFPNLEITMLIYWQILLFWNHDLQSNDLSSEWFSALKSKCNALLFNDLYLYMAGFQANIIISQDQWRMSGLKISTAEKRKLLLNGIENY